MKVENVIALCRGDARRSCKGCSRWKGCGNDPGGRAEQIGRRTTQVDVGVIAAESGDSSGERGTDRPANTVIGLFEIVKK
jgi:hypothetical protein